MPKFENTTVVPAARMTHPQPFWVPHSSRLYRDGWVNAPSLAAIPDDARVIIVQMRQSAATTEGDEVLFVFGLVAHH
jgi:hypothetical protein